MAGLIHVFPSANSWQTLPHDDVRGSMTLAGCLPLFLFLFIAYRSGTLSLEWIPEQGQDGFPQRHGSLKDVYINLLYRRQKYSISIKQTQSHLHTQTISFFTKQLQKTSNMSDIGRKDFSTQAKEAIVSSDIPPRRDDRKNTN